MEYVNPIKKVEQINKIKNILKKQSYRDFLLFVFGINTGIRISDLLQIKINDIWDGENVKEFIYITEDTSDEKKAYYLNNKIKNAVNNYLADNKLNENDFLFKSKLYDKPITRQQAYRIINKAAKESGIEEKIGTHTLRKTFGYHAYKKGIAISILKSRFNHSTPAETLRYIGIEKNTNHHIRIDVNL